MNEKPIQPSVSTSDIFSFSIRDITSDPIFFLILLFPIYLLIGFAYTFTDLVIVYNLDWQSWEHTYSLRNFFIGFIYICFESYVFAIIALIIHNKVIKKKLVISFFSKELFIYSIFYLVGSHNAFLNQVFVELEFYISVYMLIFLIFGLGIFVLIFLLTFWLWVLYLPNIAVKDNYSFIYIFKNSKGARLTIFIQLLYYLIFAIPYLLIMFFHSLHLATILVSPAMILFAIIMLSNTYLEWQLLEKNRK